MKKMTAWVLTGLLFPVCTLPVFAEGTVVSSRETASDTGAIVAAVVFVLVLVIGIFCISRYNRRDQGIDDK